MIANIPFSLSENLAPRELGELLTMAQERKLEPEELIVFAVRDFLQEQRALAQKPLTGGAAVEAAMAA